MILILPASNCIFAVSYGFLMFSGVRERVALGTSGLSLSYFKLLDVQAVLE